MTHKNRESYEVSFFERLDVLFRGLEASPVDGMSFKGA
jgi:hypothetical protein